jgi:hypothetical protein
MVRNIIWFGFFARVGVAIWNGFFGPSFGAELDAASFHLRAVDYARSLELDSFSIGWFYSYALGIVYSITVSSLFLGSLLSCFAWLYSATLLKQIMLLLCFSRDDAFQAMRIYVFLPSAIFFTSVTLREPFQLMFVNLAIYSGLKIYLEGSARHWLVIMLAVIGMGVLHGGLFAFGLFVVISTMVLLTLRGRKGFSLAKLAVVAPLAGIGILYGLSLFASFSYNLNDGLGAAVESYQQGGLNTIARTNYKSSVEIDGALGLLLFFPVSFFQYLFEPMPWRVSALSDIAMLFENVIRAWLMWRAVAGLRTMPMRTRRVVLFVFLSALVLEAIWSLGTINWGTAARHHIPSLGILVIAAFAYSRASNKPRRSRHLLKGVA